MLKCGHGGRASTRRLREAQSIAYYQAVNLRGIRRHFGAREPTERLGHQGLPPQSERLGQES